jgi:hypothetical protein
LLRIHNRPKNIFGTTFFFCWFVVKNKIKSQKMGWFKL